MEKSIVGILRSFGGETRQEGGAIRGRFDETAIAFWLDAAGALEAIASVLEANAASLFGCCCLATKPTAPEGADPRQFKSLLGSSCPTRIWCDAPTAAALAEYAAFGVADRFFPLLSFAPRPEIRGAPARWIREALVSELVERLPVRPGASAGTLALVGQGLCGKRQAVRAALSRSPRAFPAFAVEFGRGGPSALSRMADALDALPQDALAAQMPEFAERACAREVQALRLRDEVPAELAVAFASFVAAAAAAYARASRARGVPAVIVLEDVHEASPPAAAIAAAAFGEPASRGEATLLLTSETKEALAPWQGFLPRILMVGAPSSFDLEKIVRAERGEEAALPSDLVRACSLQASVAGYPGALRCAAGWNLNAEGKPTVLHPRITADYAQIAYAACLFGTFLSPGGFAAAYAAGGASPETFERAARALAALGVLESAERPAVVLPGGRAFLEGALGSRAEPVRKLALERLLKEVAAKTVLPSFGLLRAIADLGGDCGDDLALESVEAELRAGTGACIEAALLDGSFPRVVGRDRAEALAYLACSRAALLSTTGAAPVLPEPAPEAFSGPRFRAQALLDSAAAAFGRRDAVAAAGRSKDALVLLQGLKGKPGIARAYRQLGMAECSCGRIGETLDYYGFAAESADAAKDERETFLVSAYSAAAQLLWGNYAKAAREAESATEVAAAAYSGEWSRWARFFRARLLFETGRYGEAARMFAESEASDRAGAQEKELAAVWRIRASVFAGVAGVAGEAAGLGPKGDAALVAVEAAYLSGDFEAAASLAADYRADSPPAASNPEKPDWSSGFALAEDLVAERGATRTKLVRAYGALARSALGGTDAVGELRDLAKDERRTRYDPSDSFYFYAYCRSLVAASAAAIDVSTSLSIAFKRLQERASRIDDTETKRAFLTLNRWNSALLADARRHNLI